MSRAEGHTYTSSQWYLPLIDLMPLFSLRMTSTGAMGWLLEAEASMAEIFKGRRDQCRRSRDGEILHFVKIHDGEYGVSEQKIIRFARDRLPIHSIHQWWIS